MQKYPSFLSVCINVYLKKIECVCIYIIQYIFFLFSQEFWDGKLMFPTAQSNCGFKLQSDAIVLFRVGAAWLGRIKENIFQHFLIAKKMYITFSVL